MDPLRVRKIHAMKLSTTTSKNILEYGATPLRKRSGERLNDTRLSERIFIAQARGLTLIEVMIATTLTLLLMLALAQGFKTLSETVSAGRSKLTMSDQLRGISTLLRSDLEGLTVDSSNPQSSLASNGYFKYYDGPLSDFTATLFNYLPAGTVEQRVSANRWGDIDDIVMFTAKAKEGEWFRGKVPKALLLVSNLNKGIPIPSMSVSDWNEAWATDVSIASQYAEIAWFMRPLQESDQSATAPVSQRYPINIQELQPTGYSIPPETSVSDFTPGAGDGMPDRIALCRRVLLIRPDLDISESAASTAAFSGRDPQLIMKPLTPGGTVPSFRYMMRFPYQRCDLSVRPITNDFVAASSGLTVQCNSLADLQRPENRFSHYTIPLPVLGLGLGTSMPLLALTSEVGSSGNYLSLTNQAFGFLSPASPSIPVQPADRGFIPSCFFRTKITLNPTTQTQVGSAVPTLEEIVASNVVAFDLKGYDLSVKQLANVGADGAWGAASVDDDGDGTVDNFTEAGWPGTDDLSLTPSDPGYSKALINASSLVSPSQPAVFSNSGAFVDIDWSRKVINASHNLSTGVVQLGMANIPASVSTLWTSNLSGVQFGASGIQRKTSFVKSGSYFVEPTTGVVVYQPCFDTFTDAYESDGEYMEFVIAGAGDASYVAWRDGLRRFGIGSGTAPSGSGDQGTDGIGIDEIEKETGAPISYRLPSIQATIRVQDYTAGNLQQISIVHELNSR